MIHDAFDHLVSREKKHWALPGSPITESYVNNRHAGWSYDAAGNLLQTGVPTMTYAYDAAGRMYHTNSDSRVDITQSFGGDGQILKRYEVDTIYPEGEPPYTQSSTLYQLRSSALGGKVLTEMGAQGQKFRTYVYANGGLLAWQHVVYLNGSVYYQGPVWEHRDASNASYRLTGPTSYVDPEDSAELDPFNSNMGLENPYHFPPDPPPPHKPNIFYPGFGTGGSSYCVADGIERNCSEVSRLLSLGLAEQCQNNNCGPGIVPIKDPNGTIIGEGLAPLTRDPVTGRLGYAHIIQGSTSANGNIPPALKPALPHPDPGNRNPFGIDNEDDFTFADGSETPLSEGIEQARQALQENSLCRAIFFGTDPMKLLDTYSSNSLITSGSSYQVARKGGGTRTKGFASGDIGAATSLGAGSYPSPTIPGLKISASPITINKNGFFFSGRTTRGIALSTIKDRGFYGLSIGQLRGEVILHELLHVADRIPTDFDDPVQSQRNSEHVRRFCFPNRLLSTTTNFSRRL